MALKSKLSVARPGTTSLRTTVPEGCVDFLGAKDKDELLWEMEDWTPPGSAEKTRVLVVRKA